jgi:hypothetical protein
VIGNRYFEGVGDSSVPIEEPLTIPSPTDRIFEACSAAMPAKERADIVSRA